MKRRNRQLGPKGRRKFIRVDSEQPAFDRLVSESRKRATNKIVNLVPGLPMVIEAAQEVILLAETVPQLPGELLSQIRKHSRPDPVNVPQAMLIENIVQPAKKMVRFSRRRPKARGRARGRVRRSGRGRRGSVRRRRKSTRGRAPKMRLRLYPGGFPRTHIVKLRSMKQMQITHNPANWGFVKFFPSSMKAPLASSNDTTEDFNTRIATPTQLVHRSLIFTDKAGLEVPTLAQPYGYDAWLQGFSDTGSSITHQYDKYKVLGCKITLAFIPDTSTEGGTQVYGGFSKIQDQNSLFGTTFINKYAEINRTEVSDFLNVGMVKDLKLLQAGGSGLGGVQKAFTFNYSAKKYARHLKRVGVEQTSDWYGTHQAAPNIMPEAIFLMADLGASSTAHAFSVMVIHDYTIQLTGSLVSAQSIDT